MFKTKNFKRTPDEDSGMCWILNSGFQAARSGQAVLTSVLFLLFVSGSFLASFASIALKESRASRIDTRAKQTLFLAEAAIEDAIYRIQKNRAIGASESIALDGHSASVTVSSPSDDEYALASEGNVSQAIRRISVRLEKGIGASFVYGAQVGYLGLDLENSAARIVGSVYSNGPITANNYPR
ncbi:MAG: hypothetical protein AAB844_01045, partial [Patescibacteria group bacterium]